MYVLLLLTQWKVKNVKLVSFGFRLDYAICLSWLCET